LASWRTRRAGIERNLGGSNPLFSCITAASPDAGTLLGGMTDLVVLINIF
jgi:hypothetical protein